MKLEGRAWVFGDNVNTDLIIPGKYLDNYDPDHLAAHAMEGIRKDFATNVKAGDIVIAGMNFGCGSSREQAVIALKQSGISVVVAKSFGRIFYRNAINLGMPVITSQNATDAVGDGEMVVVDLDRLVLSPMDGRASSRLDQIPPKAFEILDSGGLVPHIKRMLKDRDKA